MTAFLDCPECNLPSEVSKQYIQNEVECVQMRCIQGHLFTCTAQWLIDKNFEYVPLPEVKKLKEMFLNVYGVNSYKDLWDIIQKMSEDE